MSKVHKAFDMQDSSFKAVKIITDSLGNVGPKEPHLMWSQSQMMCGNILHIIG